MDKKEALEKYLGVEVKQSEYDENTFVTEDGEEYLVLDGDEADKATHDDIENFIDDAGIEGFTPGFQDWIYNNAVDEDFLYQVVEEEIDFLVGDMLDDAEALLERAKELEVLPEDATEEDLYDGIDEDIKTAWLDEIAEKSTYAEYIEDNFGKEELSDIVKKNNAIDLDKIVEECISWDGRGHFLAKYDGTEHELEGDEPGYIEYYAYRTN